MANVTDEQPFLARYPGSAWIAVLTHNTAEHRVKQDSPPFDELIDRELTNMEEEGCGLVDLRLASAAVGDYGTEQTVVLIGRKLDPDSE